MNVSFVARYSVLTLLALTTYPLYADQGSVSRLLVQTGVSRGICSFPACGDASLALEVVRETEFLVHAFDGDPQSVAVAIERCREAGLLTNRIVVERLAQDPLPYADNFVDLLVVSDAGAGVKALEVSRTVRPRGWAMIRDATELAVALERLGFESVAADDDWKLVRKPALSTADDWSHWYHDPDNNPVSTDATIQAPYLTQWLGAPYYHAMPVVSTVSAGRVFVASGHIAHHDREIPTLNTLVARNGYNGRVLWQRKLPAGYLVHRSAFIATPEVFFLIEGPTVTCLDPETGRQLERLEVPGAKGTLVWIAKVGDILYALAERRRTADGNDASAQHRTRLGMGSGRQELFARGRAPDTVGIWRDALSVRSGPASVIVAARRTRD